ncbi:MAG TPA: glycosyltransferase [Gemmataceae bacterium]|nr:glycosyltransferase [Gemmataceae bacterium]
MFVSVVIPTYRRPDLLARCLAAVTAQDLAPERYEVIVADDAANEVTRRQVESISGPVAVRYVAVAGNHGPAAARNRGWHAARGEVIAFTDDDTVPDRGWLGAGLRSIDVGADAVAGRVVVPLPPVPTDYELNESGLERAEFVTANCFVRRTALKTVGGFDERFTAAWREDSDLQFALLERGFRIDHAADALVVHPVRPARRGVSLRLQRKGQFDALLYRKHSRLFRQRIRPARPWDYYGTVAALAAGAGSAAAGHWLVALAALAIWSTLTVRFIARRLRGTSRRPGDVAEMALTSLLIPPLSMFWRICGAVRFRVWFF